MRPSSEAVCSTNHTRSLERPADSSDSERGQEKPTGQEQQRLTIVIFRGDPIDAPQYRHTALLIEHLNQEGVRTDYRTLEVIGSAGIFEREENATCDPGKSATFVGSVAVATIPVTGSSSSRLRDVIWSTPINNSENSWNCQNWVGDALNLCIGDKLILSEESDRAIDGMVDYILQARDVA